MKKPIFIIIIVICSALFFALSYRGIVYMQEKIKASEKPAETPVYKITVVDVADTVPEDVGDLIDDYVYGDIDYSQYYDDVEPIANTEEQVDESVQDNADIEEITEAEQQPDKVESEDNTEFIIMTVQTGKGTLNLRKAPDKSAEVIYDLENGSEVKVYPDSLENGFYKIYVDDETIGWASSTYIK